MGKMNFKKHNDLMMQGSFLKFHIKQLWGEGGMLNPFSEPPRKNYLRYDQTLTLNMASWISLKRRKVL